MADPQPIIEADQGSGKGIKAIKEDTGGFNTEIGGLRHQLQQRRDAETVTFTSPYYDPFGDDRELEAELLHGGGGGGGGRQAGTTPPTIQAYDSTGTHRS